MAEWLECWTLDYLFQFFPFPTRLCAINTAEDLLQNGFILS